VVQIFETIRKEVDRAPGAPARTRRGASSNANPLPQVQIAAPASAPFEQAMSWLEAIFKRAATAGIVVVFTVLVLLDRVELRDRLLRLWSGNLHRSTDALDEAGQRISKYLTMQLVVNLSYGIPMALGLWLIGVPGAILWGAIAAVLRFIPYLGPLISMVFPVALAFAVDPGWSMILWTIAFIGLLELISNNVVEPWLYGASTGLSTLSLIVSATFWTALWGPIGLVMSTPLTVCLMVIGRHLPRLKFLDVLLGSQPALEMPTRVYQRLLARDVEEAVELANQQIESSSLVDFYSATAIPVLRMASEDHAAVATAEHRHRLVTGMDTLIDELREEYGEPKSAEQLDVLCIGGKWEIDSLAAKMLAHSLASAGRSVAYRPASPLNADWIALLDLRGARAICVSYFSPRPEVAARTLCKRLRRRWPDLEIVLALWNAPAELLTESGGKALGADAVVTWLNEAVMLLQETGESVLDGGYRAAPVPEHDSARVAALQASGALDPRAAALFDAASHRAADIFDVGMAMVSLIGFDDQKVPGAFGSLPLEGGPDALTRADLEIPRALSMCGHVVADGATLVVPDVSRDIRFANNPALQGKLRFYAGAPLREASGHVLGTLCLLGAEPRALTERDVKLLEALAKDLMSTLAAAKRSWDQEASAGEGHAASVMGAEPVATGA
ncbi:MAG: AI-2E family transporter, partial [Proteobacteria bacterium]